MASKSRRQRRNHTEHASRETAAQRTIRHAGARRERGWPRRPQRRMRGSRPHAGRGVLHHPGARVGRGRGAAALRRGAQPTPGAHRGRGGRAVGFVPGRHPQIVLPAGGGGWAVAVEDNGFEGWRPSCCCRRCARSAWTPSWMTRPIVSAGDINDPGVITGEALDQETGRSRASIATPSAHGNERTMLRWAGRPSTAAWPSRHRGMSAAPPGP
jgi:hypothetical protein